MSTPYGQQPPYGPSPYGQPNPYGQPQQPQPYGRPGPAPYGQPQPYGGQPSPYAPGQPGQPAPPAGYPAAPVPPPYQPGFPPPPGQWPAEGVGVGPPAVVQRSVLVLTLDAVPGRTVTGVLGEVVGVVARSRELPRELRTANPLDGYASMLTRSRQDAVARMVEMAEAAGADAVLGLRYDSSEITQTLSEVTAYGTAVTLSPAPAGTPTPDAATAVEPLTPPDFVGAPDFDDADPAAPGSRAPDAADAPAQDEDGAGSVHPASTQMASTQQPAPQGSTAVPTQPWPPQWPAQG